MRPDALDLARRLVACPEWRYPGPPGAQVMCQQDTETPWPLRLAGGGVLDEIPDQCRVVAVDLDDWATVGAMLGMADWATLGGLLQSLGGTSPSAGEAGEAVARALLAAWGRA